MTPYQRIFYLISSLIVIASMVHISTSYAFAGDEGFYLTEDIQLNIADTFFRDEEYYRAITEYKRFLIMFPTSSKTDYGLFKIGESYFRGHEFEEAAETFNQFRQRFTNSQYLVRSHYFEGMSYWKIKDYENAKLKFDTIVDFYPNNETAPSAIKAKALIALDKDNLVDSKKELKYFTDKYSAHPDKIKVNEAIILLEENGKEPKKSKALAATMSAIIPGSGYMYAKHYGDGVTAFIVNALFISGTLTAIDQENYTTAYVMGALGLPFYIGNIYGSANAAKKWNLGVRRELHNKIYITLGFDIN